MRVDVGAEARVKLRRGVVERHVGAGLAADGPCRPEDGGRLSKKPPITPSRIEVVMPALRTVGQNVSVLKASTMAIDPPWISIAVTGMTPPEWNIGRLIM